MLAPKLVTILKEYSREQFFRGLGAAVITPSVARETSPGTPAMS